MSSDGFPYLQPNVCKYRVLVECESSSYEFLANELRVQPVASRELINQEVNS